MTGAAPGGRAHPHQLDPDGHMSDRWTGDLTHSRDLHAVTVQCRTMLGNHHNHGAAATFLHCIDEACHVAEHHRGASLVVRRGGTPIGPHDAIAIVQGDRVVKQGNLRGRFGLPAFQPAHQDVTVAVQGRVVECDQCARQAVGIHRFGLQPAIGGQLTDEIIEVSIVIHCQLVLEAQSLQIGEQLALCRHLIKQSCVRGLSATRAEQADRGGTAIGRRRVERIKHHVHVVKQVVLTHPYFVQITPGQRTYVEDDHIERSTCRRAGEVCLECVLLLVEIGKVGIEAIGIGRTTRSSGTARRRVGSGDVGTFSPVQPGRLRQGDDGQTQHAEHTQRGHPQPGLEQQVSNDEQRQCTDHGPVDETGHQLKPVGRREIQYPRLRQQTLERRPPGILVVERDADWNGQHTARNARPAPPQRHKQCHQEQ
ncbi:hypothetical protein D3C71_1211650 [compost metagenome]